jgi:hypothetical protein
LGVQSHWFFPAEPTDPINRFERATRFSSSLVTAARGKEIKKKLLSTSTCPPPPAFPFSR